MTDRPRFEPVSCRPEEAHRRYHGGRLVALVFGIVDHWALQRPAGRAPRSLKFEVRVPIALVLLLIGVAGLSAAHSQKSLRSVAAEMMLGRDTSPDDEVCVNRRRPQSAYPQALYAP
jgi:hypothetical protein